MQSYGAIAAILAGAIAWWSVITTAVCLQRDGVAASVRAYEASKRAYVAILGLATLLLSIGVVRSYGTLLAIYALDFIAWRLAATTALRRRDRFAKRSG
jgi:hypothetical protein